MTRRNTKLHSSHPQSLEQPDLCTTLPPELIELISENLSALDVLSLRQTCRYLHTCSKRAFTEHWIAERPFLLLNKHSLEKLTNIVNTPERRRQLKCISIAMASLVPEDEDIPRRKRYQGVVDRSSRAKQRAQRAIYEQRRGEQAALCNFDDTGAVQALADAFATLQANGMDVTLEVTKLGFPSERNGEESASCQHVSAWGYERLCRESGYRQPLQNSRFKYRIISYVLDALDRMPVTPTVLELGSVDGPVPVDLMNFNWLEPWLTMDDRQPFAKVTSLRLCLTLDMLMQVAGFRYLEELTTQRDDFLAMFYQALQGASALRTLGLSVGNGRFDVDFLGDELWNTIYSNDSAEVLQGLTELELDGLTIHINDLHNFVIRRQDTLRKVRLRWIKGCTSLSLLNGDGTRTPKVPESIRTSLLVNRALTTALPQCEFTMWKQVYLSDWHAGERLRQWKRS